MGVTRTIVFLISILWGASFAGCSMHDGVAARTKVKAIAEQRYESGFEIQPDSTGRYLLCVETGKERPGLLMPLQFFVYDTVSDGISYERSGESGSVQWLSGSLLLIRTIPGNISGDEDPDRFTEIYDVARGQRHR